MPFGWVWVPPWRASSPLGQTLSMTWTIADYRPTSCIMVFQRYVSLQSKVSCLTPCLTCVPSPPSHAFLPLSLCVSLVLHLMHYSPLTPVLTGGVGFGFASPPPSTSSSLMCTVQVNYFDDIYVSQYGHFSISYLTGLRKFKVFKGGNRPKLKVSSQIWEELFQKAFEICDQMTQKEVSRQHTFETI